MKGGYGDRDTLEKYMVSYNNVDLRQKQGELQDTMLAYWSL